MHPEDEGEVDLWEITQEGVKRKMKKGPKRRKSVAERLLTTFLFLLFMSYVLIVLTIPPLVAVLLWRLVLEVL